MKTLLSLLTIGTLTSTTISNVSVFITTNLNQQSTNKVNDVLLPNSSEITGYTGAIKNYKIDLFGNVFFTTDNAIYKVNVGTTNAIEIFEFNIGEVDNLIFDSQSNFYFTIKTSDEENKIYNVSVGTKNVIEITGYTGAAFSFFFDSKNNLYFYSEYKNGSSLNNKFYKVNANSFNISEITKFNDNFNPQKFIKDSKNNLYFIDNISKNFGILESDKTEIENLDVTGINIKDYYNIQSLNIDNSDNIWFNVWTNKDNAIYKVNVGTTNAIEIVDIGNGKFKNLKFDSKNNLYFTNESNLFIFDSKKHHYQLTDFKRNTEYVFFTFDSKNNLYFGIKNSNETIDLYKQLYDEQKLIKIDDYVQNYEFTWKEQDNINFDNENNLYYVKKNNNEQLSIFYLKNNEWKSQLIFTFNKAITKFNFKIKNNIIFAIIDNKIYKVDKFNLPTPPTQVNVATLILITSSIGCLVIAGGLLGYFIYYDRKYHVVKKWWEKRKEGK
ncbi:MAG: hypothetical protein PPFGHCPK_01529 (plasmid) [Spiroplasma endosymbiont of Drosophila atripex]|nr:MAG: hypothetical protein PPFGHCPK_01529 [Spiroplasma endosymbiont of Drosophila atripex]